MRILFVTHDGTSHEPLGLLYLSGSLVRAGHKTKACMQSKTLETVKSWGPDFVAFQVLTGDERRWGAVAAAVKEQFPRVKTIFGGPHFLFFAAAQQKEADYVIRGDAEEAIVDVVEGRPHRDFIPIESLDSRAHPDRGLLYNQDFQAVRSNVIRNFIACQGCLGYNTPILLSSGINIPIQEIKKGDEVLSYDVEFDRMVKRFVQNTYSRMADDLYKIEMENGIVIEITGEHPAWTPDGWKKIEELKLGNLLATSTENKTNLPVVPKSILARSKSSLGESKKMPKGRTKKAWEFLFQRMSSKNLWDGELPWDLSNLQKTISTKVTRCSEHLFERMPFETSKRTSTKKNDSGSEGEKESLMEEKQSYVEPGLQEKGQFEQNGCSESYEVPRSSCKDGRNDEAKASRKTFNAIKTTPQRRKDTSSHYKISKQSRILISRMVQTGKSSDTACGNGIILDRSVRFRDETKPRLYSQHQEVKKSASIRCPSLASERKIGDPKKGLRSLRMDSSFLVVGKSQKKEASNSAYKRLFIWNRVKKITFLGRSLVFNFTVCPTHTYLASNLVVHNCPYKCTYCFNSNENWQKMVGKGKDRLRYHSPEWIIEDIEMTFNEWGGQLVSFQDDIFGIDLDWLERFSGLYRRVRLPFFAQLRPRLITEDRIKLLKEAGVHIISFAIESGNQKNRKEVLDRDEPNELIERGCELLHRYGIKFRMQNLLGLPVDDPLADAIETLQFNIKCKPTLSWVSLLQAYPGTAIADYVIKKGIVKSMSELTYMVNATFFDEMSLPVKDKEKIERLHKYWSACVRWPWLFPIVSVLINFNLGKKFHNWFFERSKQYINAKEYWRVERDFERHLSILNQDNPLDRLGGELVRNPEKEEICA